MLKDQIIKNTWACDNCGLETDSVVDPYFPISITFPSNGVFTSCDIDLCSTCIAMITPQVVVDYVAMAIK